MKAISNALKAHYALGTTTIATCWKATLTDTTVLGATSHHEDIVFDGVTYHSTYGFSPSDIDNSAQLNPDTLELDGFLVSPSITEEDIISGRWDYAAIEMFEVNYKDLTMGRNLIRKGTLGEIKGGRSNFNVELRGIFQKLTTRLLKVTTKTCTHDLGDAQCGIDLAAHTVTGSVTSTGSQRQFTDTARATTADHFAGGVITWTSGNNNGLRMEVKQSSAAGVITLHQSMPFEIQVGDTYSMYAGCMKRFTEDCKTKFNNGANFGGFPHVPLSNSFTGPAGQ